MHQLFDLARMSFDDSDRAMRTLPTIVRACAVAVAVFVLVWLLKPDLFGLVPNSLDPMFYTGYAINLDDALAAAGNRHYFVTRWTSYMPMYVFSEVFGPYWGRLVLRLVMILVLSEMFWRVGFKLAFPAKSRLLGIFVVVTAPMFVRAFTTDYPEYFIIWGSMLVCLLVVSFSFDPSLVKSIAIGILATSILIANPFTALLLGTVLVVGIVLSRAMGVPSLNLMTAFAVIIATGLLVLIVGYLQFEYRYLIGNVYQPTLDFMRQYQRPETDGWTAPSNTWLGFFSWLYLSPILVVVLLALTRKMAGAQRKVALYFSFIALAVFAIHIYVEIRRGNALETSYYWSMSLGPVLIALFFILCFLATLQKARWTVVSLIGFCALSFWRIPQQAQLPSGVGLIVCLIFVLVLLGLIYWRIPTLAQAAFVAAVLWAQTGAPTYSQRSNGGDLNTPRYDQVYRSTSNESHLVLDELLWFLDRMEKVKDDWKSTFLSAGGWSAAIVGTYIPHPFSRWIVPISDEQVLSLNVKNELEFGSRPLLTIFGDPQQVELLLNRVKEEIPRASSVLDETHQKGLGYRLLVLRGNDTNSGESVIPMSQLDREIGRIGMNRSVTVTGGSRQGFVSFGPYFGLGTGTYLATLDFTSDEVGDIGYFEIYNDVTKESFKQSIESGGLGKQSMTVPFEVSHPGATWQLRTVYSGRSSAVFHQITLKMSKERDAP